MRKVVFDADTTVNSAHRAGRLFPFDPNNRIVALAMKDLGGSFTREWYFPEWEGKVYRDTNILPWLLGGETGPHSEITEVETPTMLIGHNVGFDILYLLKETQVIKEYYEKLVSILKEGIIWDTSIAEFYLSGGTEKFPSLDEVCDKRGLPVKDSRIKDHWDNGGKTEDIDKDMLMEYMVHDVEVTSEIATQQFAEAEEQGMTSYLLQVMKSRQATIWMEWVGAYVNAEEVTKEKEEEEDELNSILDRIRNNLAIRFGVDPSLVNPESNKQISIYFFGGKVEYDDREPVIDKTTGKPYVYKSGKKKGQVKTRKVTKTKKVEPLIINPSDVGATETLNPGVYTVGEKVLEAIAAIPTGYSVASDCLEARELRKNISTYLEGYAGMAVDSLIHCNFNYANVPTGRLSCSKPNMQNLTKEE